jgi:hypothetical protein
VVLFANVSLIVPDAAEKRMDKPSFLMYRFNIAGENRKNRA